MPKYFKTNVKQTSILPTSFPRTKKKLQFFFITYFHPSSITICNSPLLNYRPSLHKICQTFLWLDPNLNQIKPYIFAYKIYNHGTNTQPTLIFVHRQKWSSCSYSAETQFSWRASVARRQSALCSQMTTVPMRRSAWTALYATTCAYVCPMWCPSRLARPLSTGSVSTYCPLMTPLRAWLGKCKKTVWNNKKCILLCHISEHSNYSVTVFSLTLIFFFTSLSHQPMRLPNIGLAQ